MLQLDLVLFLSPPASGLFPDGCQQLSVCWLTPRCVSSITSVYETWAHALVTRGFRLLCLVCVCVCSFFVYTFGDSAYFVSVLSSTRIFQLFFCMKMFKKRLFFALNRRQSASNQTIIAVPVRPLKKRTLAEKSWKMRLMQLEIILQCPKHTAEWRLLWVIWYSSNY